MNLTGKCTLEKQDNQIQLSFSQFITIHKLEQKLKVLISPSGMKNLPETNLDIVELLEPVEVDRLLRVAGQVVQLAPVLGAGPVRCLGLRQLLVPVHQVDVL